jgi:hypothetical protein
MADAGLQLSLHPFEQWLKFLEVLADGAISDFLGGSFVRTPANVP